MKLDTCSSFSSTQFFPSPLFVREGEKESLVFEASYTNTQRTIDKVINICLIHGKNRVET